jgi:hypothetical protein
MLLLISLKSDQNEKEYGRSKNTARLCSFRMNIFLPDRPFCKNL